MVTREPTTLQDEAFERLIHLPENADKWFEMLKGVIYEVIMPNPLHAFIASLIYRLFGDFVVEHDLGFAFADGCMFYLPNGDKFIPDAAFVSKERQPTIPAKYEIAPDLAVEVVSPSNKPREILNKVESYIECGTRLVWVVYPDEKIVDVWRPGQNGRLELQSLNIDGILDGEAVLAGFKLAVKDIFPTT
jgi:Uma2 family endonuclease